MNDVSPHCSNLFISRLQHIYAGGQLLSFVQSRVCSSVRVHSFVCKVLCYSSVSIVPCLQFRLNSYAYSSVCMIPYVFIVPVCIVPCAQFSVNSSLYIVPCVQFCVYSSVCIVPCLQFRVYSSVCIVLCLQFCGYTSRVFLIQDRQRSFICKHRQRRRQYTVSKTFFGVAFQSVKMFKTISK